MNGFVELPADRRRLICEQAESECGLPPPTLEKDFWVCWTLRELFALRNWGQNITFKGGTSLSKGWSLIDRFSEDIDIVIGRTFLGFGGENSPEAAPSKKTMKARLQALKEETRQRIHDKLQPALRNRFAELLPKSNDWKIEPAPEEEDHDRQTLLFYYPATLAVSSTYLRPVVKIELGARSDNEPAEYPVIHPYLFDAFPDILGTSEFPVRALAPERTFWEKAMLLHEETYRPSGKKRRGVRMARHYYDLWCLITKGVAVKAAARDDIFERTARHREVYFKWTWMDYNTLKRGTLRLLPLEHQEPEWRQDYQAMSMEMFFGEVPDFDELLSVVGEFERRFNDE